MEGTNNPVSKQPVSETRTFRLPFIICQKIDVEVKKRKEQIKDFTLSQYGVEVFSLHFAQKDLSVNNANVALKLQELQQKYNTLQNNFLSLKQENESLLLNQKDTNFEQNTQERINQLEVSLKQKDEIIHQMQYTSPSGQIPTIINLKEKELLRVQEENNALKQKLKAIGETFTKVSGYYFNSHFGKLKAQIIEILTSIQ